MVHAEIPTAPASITESASASTSAATLKRGSAAAAERRFWEVIICLLPVLAVRCQIPSRGVDPGERLLAPQRGQALEQPRRDRAPRDRHPHRGEHDPWL